MRILVTVSPRMYREAIALSIRSCRPDFEVLIAPPWPLDVRAERFGPHVLVQDADEAGLPPALAGGGVACRVRVLVADRVHATIEMDGTVSEVRDACLEDLFGALEEAEALSLVARGRRRLGPPPTVCCVGSPPGWPLPLRPRRGRRRRQ